MLIRTEFLKSATAIALVMMASISAKAEDSRHDKTIEAALIAKAASRVGEMRTSISYDQPVKLVTREDVQNSINKKTSGIFEKIWVAPEPKNALPPMVYRISNNIDETITASIGNDKSYFGRKLIWEKFDAKGNLIE